MLPTRSSCRRNVKYDVPQVVFNVYQAVYILGSPKSAAQQETYALVNPSQRAHCMTVLSLPLMLHTSPCTILIPTASVVYA